MTLFEFPEKAGRAALRKSKRTADRLLWAGCYILLFMAQPVLRAQWQKLTCIDRSKPLIIALGDKGYSKIGLNWASALKKLNMTQFVIIATDKKAAALFRSAGVQTVLLPAVIRWLLLKRGPYFKVLMTIRVFLCKSLLDCGIDLIHSDLDALWLKDPRGYFEESAFDVLFSQGTIDPPAVFSRWGLVACCGLFYMKSSKMTRKMLQQLLLLYPLAWHCDDQALLNEYLYRQWLLCGKKLPRLSSFPWQQHHISYSDTIIPVDHPHLRIGVLPFKKNPRLLAHQSNDSYIVHPLTPKLGEEKENYFRRHGLWFTES